MTGVFIDKANRYACTLGRQISFGSDLLRPNWEVWCDNIYHTNNFQPGPTVRTPFSNKAFIIPLVTEDVRKVFGQPGANALSRQLYADPVKWSRDFDGFADTARYGNLLAALLNLGTQRHSGDWDRDSDGEHCNYRGRFESFGTNRLVYGPVINEYQYDIDTFPKGCPRLDYQHDAGYLFNNRFYSVARVPVISRDFSQWMPAERYDASTFNKGARMFVLDDFIRRLQQQGTLTLYGWNNHAARNVFSFSDFWYLPSTVIDQGEDYVSFRAVVGYRLVNDATSLQPIGNPVNWELPKPHSRGEYNISFLFDTTLYYDGDINPNLGIDSQYAYYKYAFDVETSDTMIIAPGEIHTNVAVVNDPVWDPYVMKDLTFHHEMLRIDAGVVSIIETPSLAGSTSVVPDDLFRDPERSGYRSPGDERLARIFAGYCHNELPDVFEFAALSTADAIESFRSDFNALEFARELPETIKLVFSNENFLRRLWDLISSVRRGHPLLSVDQLADLILTYSYGVGPLPGDLQSIVDIINNGLVAFKGIPRNLYGKFVFRDLVKFPLFKTDVKLTVRTKVRINENPSLPILWAMTADQTGFLPTLERLWALKRFSFVIDWFTSVDDKLRLWDSHAMLSMLDIGFFEHTFLFETPVPSNICRNFSIVPKDASIRFFLRQRSLFHPTPRGLSKYDPHHSSGLDLLTTGPLLWTSFK